MIAALIIGLGVGGATSLYGLLFITLDSAALSLPLPLAVLAVLGLLALARLVVRRVAGERSGSLIDLFLRIYHLNYGKISTRRAAALSLAPLITVAAGGSVGVSGSAIFFGSSLASIASRLLRLGARSVRRLMLVGGVAGIAAVFRAPISAMMFALEAPYRRDIEVGVIVPASLAAATAYAISKMVLGEQVLFHAVAPENPIPLDPWAAVHYAAIGVVAAVASIGIIRFRELLERLVERVNRLEDLGFVVVGLCTVAAYLAVPNAVGSGTRALLYVKTMGLGEAALLAVVKALLTVATLRLAGAGGVFVPSMVVGAAIGYSYALATRFPGREAAMIAGMAGIFAGVNSAPLTIIMFSLEVEGLQAAVPAIIASLTSYAITMHSSLHSNQLVLGSNRRIAALSLYARRAAARIPWVFRRRVSEFAWNPSCVIDSNTAVEDALSCLRRSGEDVVLVLEDGRVVGVALREELEAAERGTRLKEVATRPVFVDPNAELSRALRLMELLASEVLVVRGRVPHIVTASGLVDLLRRLSEEEG